MKILAILNNLNQAKANRRTDMTSFGGNNNKFNPSFDGRSIGFHIENTVYYGSNGKMDLVIDDYHQVTKRDCYFSCPGQHRYEYYAAESAIKDHPDCPKNYKIESTYQYKAKPHRIYITDPGERITDIIREDHAIIVHNLDRRRY